MKLNEGYVSKVLIHLDRRLAEMASVAETFLTNTAYYFIMASFDRSGRTRENKQIRLVSNFHRNG